ncbi:ABC transporter permease [Anaeromicropila herbilytica]|uniref:Transport permease protein n=1 Tax=Anaeromicropila herbilytica TaxID=2785025 RepID=A0A7R7EN31_9FIRM|nr:ABC transporter permease [Anaeromicropila herbilytica]BCN31813.1 transport permease protein [Anaeromicropila herbilytica]
MKAFRTMLKTELKLSIRGMDMIIFAIVFPIVMVILLGIIYGTKPAYDGADYTFLEQSFGAISTIAICAGGVMGLPLLISDYRHKKILKRFKVTPSSPILILAVHLVIYTIYSVVSLISVYILVKIFFHSDFNGSIFGFVGSYVLVILSMFSIGMLVGGVAPDAKTASIIASILYFPMLMFSGATLPYEVMPDTLQKVTDFLPLTQGVKLLKATSLGLSIDNIVIPVVSMSVLAILCISISIKCFRWE